MIWWTLWWPGLYIMPHAACIFDMGMGAMLHLRSSKHANWGDSVEAVATHQVGNVVLDLHLLTGKASSLKQLSSGGVVVLGKKEICRKNGEQMLIQLCDYSSIRNWRTIFIIILWVVETLHIYLITSQFWGFLYVHFHHHWCPFLPIHFWGPLPQTSKREIMTWPKLMDTL